MFAHPIGTIHKAVSGVYIFCRESSPGRWTALYVGEAQDINARIGSGVGQHHKATACVRAGATHICTRVVSGARAERLRVETDLRQKYTPPHNDQ
jgi:excinuclease UvrABC nuclease subunit